MLNEEFDSMCFRIEFNGSYAVRLSTWRLHVAIDCLLMQSMVDIGIV